MKHYVMAAVALTGMVLTAFTNAGTISIFLEYGFGIWFGSCLAMIVDNWRSRRA